MKIKFTKTVDVPCSPWCGNCVEVCLDKTERQVCGLSGVYLDVVRGKLLKSLSCWNRLYLELVKEGNRDNG